MINPRIKKLKNIKLGDENEHAWNNGTINFTKT